MRVTGSLCPGAWVSLRIADVRCMQAAGACRPMVQEQLYQAQSKGHAVHVGPHL